MILLIDESDGSDELCAHSIGALTLKMHLAPHLRSDAVQVLIQEFQEWGAVEVSNGWLDAIEYD